MEVNSFFHSYSQLSYKPGGLLFGWPYKTGTTGHYVFYSMFSGDHFTIVPSHDLDLGEKIVYYQ